MCSRGVTREPLKQRLLAEPGAPRARVPAETRGAERGAPHHGEGVWQGWPWGMLKAHSWRCTSGACHSPSARREGEKREAWEGVSCHWISRAWWVRMKHPHWDSPRLSTATAVRRISSHVPGWSLPKLPLRLIR